MQLQSSKKQIIFSSLLCFSAIAFPVASQARTVQEVPNPRQVNNTWVTDKANILSDSTETQLNQIIAELEAKNGSEIAVVTVPDTKPSETPKAFATELFNSWGIGKKGKNNGVLLLISSGERRVQIETGSGIKSILPDAKTVSIIQTEITPRLKQKDFDGGTLAGTKALVNVLQTPIANTQSQNVLPLAPIVPSQGVKPSPIPSQSPVISNSKSTGEDSSNLIYGLLGLLFIAFIAFIPCFIIFRIFCSLFSRTSPSHHRRYPRNYTSNNRNYSSNSHNYYGGGGDYSSKSIDYSSTSDYSTNSSSDDCGGYYSTNSSDYSISNSDCGGSFGGGDSSGGGAGGDYSISNSDCGGSFGGGDSSGGGAGGDYSISSSSSDYSSSSSSDYSNCSSSDYSNCSSSDYSSSSSSDSSSEGGGGNW